MSKSSPTISGKPVGRLPTARPDNPTAPNNSMAPLPLRFAKHPEGRGSSTDPGQPGVEFGAILALAGRAAHLEAVMQSMNVLL